MKNIAQNVSEQTPLKSPSRIKQFFFSNQKSSYKNEDAANSQVRVAQAESDSSMDDDLAQHEAEDSDEEAEIESSSLHTQSKPAGNLLRGAPGGGSGNKAGSGQMPVSENVNPESAHHPLNG